MRTSMLFLFVATLMAAEEPKKPTTEPAKSIPESRQEEVSRRMIAVQATQNSVYAIKAKYPDLISAEQAEQAENQRYREFVGKLRQEFSIPGNCDLTPDKRWVILVAGPNGQPQEIPCMVPVKNPTSDKEKK